VAPIRQPKYPKTIEHTDADMIAANI